MLELSFKQTKAEFMVRAAATTIFNALLEKDYPIKTLAEITEGTQYGYTASATNESIGFRYVRITDLKDGEINWDTVPYCQCDDPEKYLLHPGDILFARTGATTGKTHLVTNASNAVFASYLIRLRPRKSSDSQFLCFFFQSDTYWSQIADEKEGSAQPNVNGRKLTTIKLPMVDDSMKSAISNFLTVVRRRQDGINEDLPELPSPLEEQRRIVGRSEELAGTVAEARGLRERAIEESQSFVTSLHLSLSESRIIKLREIFTLDEIHEAIIPAKKYPQVGVKGFGGGLFAKESIDSTQTTYKIFNHLYQGALVLSQVKGWEGAVAVCPPNLVGKYVSPEYRTFRCIPEQAIPEYIATLVATPWFWEKLKDLTRGMGGRRERIRPEQFLSLEIPMPTIDKQYKALKILNKVQECVPIRQQALKKLDVILPAILDKAFKGEL